MNSWPEDALRTTAEKLLRTISIFKDVQLLEKSILFCTEIHQYAAKNLTR